jgi:glycine/D-amino acid oxidase-like deaminating enzyme/nitrite reductase/ring-hydroxylating ferredoxin subunit
LLRSVTMKDPTIANDSGSTRSTWMEEHVPSFDAEIAEDEHPDVCVIGAGIAGLSVALSLVRDGIDVLVLDQGPIGGGQTARTSAHLASALDDYFHVLEHRFGKQGAKLCYESHAAAIDEIERNVQMFGIDCDFRRVDAFLFAGREDHRAMLEKELDASKRVGLSVEEVGRAPLPFDTGPCLRFGNQAEFHPLKYLRGIAAAVVAGGGRIHTGVHVNDVKAGSPVEITLANGRTLTAEAVVDATQMAITSRFNMPLREAAYRTYIVALEIPHQYIPHALYWDTLDPYHYIRVQAGDDGNEILLVGGEDHRVGQSDPEIHFPQLEAWAREHFPDCGPAVATWSGQIQEPSDGMAYIGRLPGHPNVYVVTGDSGNGLTHGTVAGLLLPALIQNQSHPWKGIYAPNRSRLRGAVALAKEVVQSNIPYVDWMRGGDVETLDDIRPGHGATIRKGLHVIAAYKDDEGQCHLMNARCPHFGGAVRWNEVEKTWDCPVHGSRFDCEGRVLNGPASVGLDAAPADIDSPAQIPEPVIGEQVFDPKLA